MSKAMRDLLAPKASPHRLAVLRVLLGGILLLEAISWTPGLRELFSRQGFLNDVLLSYLVDSEGQGFFSWFVPPPAYELLAIRLVHSLYLSSLTFLIVGWHTRAFTILTWFLFRLLYSRGPLSTYGVDHYTAFVLFYLVFAPTNSAFSLDAVQGRSDPRPSRLAGLGVQTLRLHVTLTYLAAGIGKARGAQWWNGDAIWRTLNTPLYSRLPFGWLAWQPNLAKLAARGTLFLELGYPFLLWNRRFRPYGVVAVLGLHLGIGYFMGLVSFSAVMAALTFALFWPGLEEPGSSVKSFSPQLQVLP